MNPLKYIKQIHAHRQRMKRWANLYADIDGKNKTLRAVLYIHDLEKWLFLPWLLFYKKNSHLKVAARALYDSMNTVGSVIVRLRTLFHPISDVQEALWLEKVFDVLDRHLDPVALEEFGISEPRPLSDFLKSSQLELAEKFKPYWNEIY